MNQYTNVNRDYPSQVLGFSVDPAAHAADMASEVADAFGRQIPNGWKIEDAARALGRAQTLLYKAAPYVDVMSRYDSPGGQLAAELDEIRNAVEVDLLAQNPNMDPVQAAQAVTPAQVAKSVGSVLGNRLFAAETNPDSLRTPMLRQLASVYVKQRFGASATPDDIVKKRMPPAYRLRAAAPEILQALGFSPEHPMVLSADRGGTLRGVGKFLAAHKLEAITKIPLLARHIQGALPPTGEKLRDSFDLTRYFVGSALVDAVATSPYARRLTR